MRIDLTYGKVVDLLRKRRNGFYPVSQFNADAERAQLDAFGEYFEGYSATQKLHDALSPFKASYVFTLSTSLNGLISLPDDYGHLLSDSVFTYDNVAQKTKRKKVTFVNEDELDAALESQVRPVNIYPIAVGGNKVIQLYPEVAQSGRIEYLRLPKKPKFAYITVGRKQSIDVSASQDIEFSELYMSNIIAKIVDYAAAFLDDKEAMQFADKKQAQTA